MPGLPRQEKSSSTHLFGTFYLCAIGYAPQVAGNRTNVPSQCGLARGTLASGHQRGGHHGRCRYLLRRAPSGAVAQRTSGRRGRRGRASSAHWPSGSAALEAAGALLQERRESARQRQAVIAANAELQERELIKLASLASAIAGALRRRGVSELAASLAAEAGIAVFRIAFERWISETSQPGLPQLIRESLDELKAVTAGK